MAIFLIRTIGWLLGLVAVLLVPVGIVYLNHYNELSLKNLAPTLGYSAFLLAIAAFLLLFIRPNKSAPSSNGGSA
jgi:hypothetical protein